MRKKMFLLIGMIVLLVGCSEKEDKVEGKAKELDIGIYETMQEIMGKQEELGNTKYEYDEYLTDYGDIEGIDVDFIDVKNVNVFDKEVENVFYEFVNNGDDIILINATYEFRDKGEEIRKVYDHIENEMTKEYGKPTKQDYGRPLDDDEMSPLFYEGKELNVNIMPGDLISIMFSPSEVDPKLLEREKILSYKENALKHAPEFTLQQINPNVDLNEITLSNFQGKLVVLNFFATYAKPSEEEIPVINELADTYEDVEFIGISLDIRDQVVEQFIEKYDLTIPIARDGEEEPLVMDSYVIGPIPTTLVIDEEGRILEKIEGVFDKEELEKIIIENK